MTNKEWHFATHKPETMNNILKETICQYEQLDNLKQLLNNSIYRFILNIKMKYQNNSKTLVILMKNPSTANENQMDNTVSTIIDNFCMEYSRIVIFNLSPLVDGNSKFAEEKLQNENISLEINRKFINRYINEELTNFDFLLATGEIEDTPSKKKTRSYQELYKIILDDIESNNPNNIYVLGTSGSKYISGRHPKACNGDFHLYKLDTKKSEYFNQTTKGITNLYADKIKFIQKMRMYLDKEYIEVSTIDELMNMYK
ncbi:DUF1643 domain-containing protein [Holzapfeliella sp. JNUCC 80]